jgi:hypothetical protein
MIVYTSEYRIRGASHVVPTVVVGGREVIAVGRWLRVAMLKDEEWLEGEPVADPERFIAELRASGLKVDLLAYSTSIDAERVPTKGRCELDNAAVIRIDDYKGWWDGLPQEARKNARRAAKRGVEVRVARYDAEFVAGIKAIYDESPIRQGRRFWHFGKDMESVKRENASYLDRCEFLGAYHAGELIGFLKLVFVGNAGRIMQILSFNAHQERRPMVALIVKAAESCHVRGLKYLVYGKYTYGRKSETSIMEFKRRLGFVQKDFPRYYAPLTWRGRIAIAIGVHAGWLGVLPNWLIHALLRMRGWWLEKANWRLLSKVRVSRGQSGTPAESDSPNRVEPDAV